MFISKKKYKELTDKIEQNNKDVRLFDINHAKDFQSKYPNGSVFRRNIYCSTYFCRYALEYKYVNGTIEYVKLRNYDAGLYDKEIRIQYKIIDKSHFAFIQIKYKNNNNDNNVVETYIVDKKNRTANEYNENDLKVNFDKVDWVE